MQQGMNTARIRMRKTANIFCIQSLNPYAVRYNKDAIVLMKICPEWEKIVDFLSENTSAAKRPTMIPKTVKGIIDMGFSTRQT